MKSCLLDLGHAQVELAKLVGEDDQVGLSHVDDEDLAMGGLDVEARKTTHSMMKIICIGLLICFVLSCIDIFMIFVLKYIDLLRKSMSKDMC